MNQENEFSPEIGSPWMGLGEVQAASMECPGVWYISVKPDPEIPSCEEYYAVSVTAGAISGEAKTYGQYSPDRPGVALYPLYSKSGEWKIIEFEVQKYRTLRKIPLPDGVTLLETAWEGRGAYPACFGTYPAPITTPRGRTLRHKSISNGIYWLETDQCRQIVAIQRGMRDELSETAIALSAQDNGLQPDTWGYFFFPKEASCIPVFELMPLFPEWEEAGLIDKAALMNAVFRYYPQYAIAHNLREQTGGNDLIGEISQKLDVFYEPHRSDKNMVALSEEANVEFYTFLKE